MAEPRPAAFLRASAARVRSEIKRRSYSASKGGMALDEDDKLVAQELLALD